MWLLTCKFNSALKSLLQTLVNGYSYQAIRSFAAASEQGAQMKFVYEATNEAVKRELKIISQKFTYADGRPFNFDPERDVLTFEQLGYRYGN